MPWPDQIRVAATLVRIMPSKTAQTPQPADESHAGPPTTFGDATAAALVPCIVWSVDSGCQSKPDHADIWPIMPCGFAALGELKMRKITSRVLAAAATCALLAACAQPAPSVQALPVGPTLEEVVEYAAAQAKYRAAEAAGNGDAVTQALHTFSQISQEILSRQDPRLFEAQVVCERYRVGEPYIPNGMQTSFAPRFRYSCDDIELRFTDATEAIRRDLEERIAAADRAVIAQAGAGRP
jgi:hypothetical protein